MSDDFWKVKICVRDVSEVEDLAQKLAYWAAGPAHRKSFEENMAALEGVDVVKKLREIVADRKGSIAQFSKG